MSNEPRGLINMRLFVVGLILIIVMVGYYRWPAHPQPASDMVRVVMPLPTLMPTATPPLVVPMAPAPAVLPTSVVPAYNGGNTTNVNVNVNVCVGFCR